VREIERLGLEVSTEKTQIVCVSSCAVLNRGRLFLKGKELTSLHAIKYLSVHLDGDLSFDTHFIRVAEKVNGVIRMLNNILPNCRGPGERKRRLYLNVVLSIILYGAPIWYKKLCDFVR